MSDLMLRTAVITQVHVYSVAQALARSAHQAVGRVTREQTGQDMVEYGGVLLLVALIIGALLATGVPGHVGRLIKSAVDNVFSGQNSSVTAK